MIGFVGTIRTKSNDAKVTLGLPITSNVKVDVSSDKSQVKLSFILTPEEIIKLSERLDYLKSKILIKEPS